MNKIIFTLLMILISVSVCSASPNNMSLDLETGLAQSGYNNVRIPGDTGTKVSLYNELKPDDALFVRLRLNYHLTKKNIFSLLIAPLTINSNGKVNRDLHFAGADFPANTELHTTFKFNSYRLTYRYTLFQGKAFSFACGITGKIRDAKIQIKSNQLEAEKKDLGFVPLINFKLDYIFNDRLNLLCMGDALAAPQGRAEDVLLAAVYNTSDKLKFKLGYRVIEGGADNDAVYTFSLIHYYVIGGMFYF